MKLIAVVSLIALVSAASIEIEAETEGKRNVGINTDSNETLSNATLVPSIAGSVALIYPDLLLKPLSIR